ncbi:hypothetical protein [Niallia sp. Krafla_26]
MDLPLLLIDHCRSRQGQSGSPVIAYRKESDLGLVWKASAIKELIDSI